MSRNSYTHNVKKDELYNFFEKGISIDEITENTGLSSKTILRYLSIYNKKKRATTIKATDTTEVIDKPVKRKYTKRKKVKGELYCSLSESQRETIKSLIDEELKPNDISLITGIDIKQVKVIYKNYHNVNGHIIKPDCIENYNIILELRNREILAQNIRINNLVGKISELESKVEKLQKENRRLKEGNPKRESIKIY